MVRLDGKVDPSKRAPRDKASFCIKLSFLTGLEICDRFNDPKQGVFLFLISTLAGGVGLNLTSANKVVILWAWTYIRSSALLT